MRIKRFQYLFLMLVVGYILLTLVTPIDAATTARYHLSEMQVRMIGLTISVPLALIWLVALYGYTRFKTYAETIAKEKEGKAFSEIAKGIMVLALSLPLTSIISSLLRQLALAQPDMATAVSIGRTYLPIIFQIIAFMYLANGAAKLLDTLRPKFSRKPYSPAIVLAFISFISLFTYVIVARPLGGTVEANYAMPAWAVVLTVVIPLIFAWYHGAIAIHQLYIYRKKVMGSLYQHMLTDLVAGLAMIAGIAIMVQILASISESLSKLNFTPILMMVYILLALYAVGYGLLAKGARRLKKIEEV